MGKVKSGSKLLQAIGKTKKEQMGKLYPKAKPKAYPKIKSKGPYTRGKVMGKGDFEARRAIMGGTHQALKKPSTKASYIEGALTGSAATAATYTYLKSKKDKEAKAKETPSHKDKARKMADDAVRKQKTKKEKFKEWSQKNFGPRKKEKHHSR